MANKVIITKSKLNALGANMKQTHGLDHNPTIDEMAALALVPTGGSGGGSGGIEIPTVSNVSVSEDGVLTFTPPTITGLTDYELSYLINVNGYEFTTTETSVNVFNYLTHGINQVSIITIVTFNDGANNVTIEYSKPISVTVMTTTLPNGLIGSASAVVGDKIYLFGGYDGSKYYNTIQCYDTTNDTLTPMSVTLPSAYAYASAAVVNGIIYIIGGYNGSTEQTYIRAYDPSTNTITSAGQLNTRDLYNVATAVINDKIYIFGGMYGSSSRLNIIQCYDPSTKTTTRMSATLPDSQILFNVAVINGMIYGIGTAQSVIFRYDPSTDTITRMNGKPQTCYDGSIASINNKAYIFGGWRLNSKYQTEYHNLIQCYSPFTDTVTPMSVTLPNPLGLIICGTANNKIYLFGGYDGSKYYNTIVEVEIEE